MQMTSHDEKVHGFERQKLERVCMKNRNLPDNHCFSNLQIMFSQAFTYLRPLIRAIGRLDKIEKNIESVIECQQLLSARLDTQTDRACEMLSKLKANPLTMGRNIGSSISNIQPTPSRDPGYGSATPEISANPSKQANPTEITNAIAELTLDAAEMSRLVETSNEILNRVFLQDTLFSDGSMVDAATSDG
ncbi:hypothetical protein LOTGIDRAFT_168022 [Lottia gigantea]|uniref:Uncharacterized protein n=1 Tax=Lottia gigantea TaxID=225164 RepID=V3Z3K9_LOTGI|nr:hypothetical protein LOTGIDRAFT_168022 [Lottia gigantea]ESO85218.1 hypothetical protein LOTGIDRAFT_168022 [Lottia gigantea]